MWASQTSPGPCLSSSNYNLDKLKQAFSRTFFFLSFKVLNIYSRDSSESNESEFYMVMLPFLNSWKDWLIIMRRSIYISSGRLGWVLWSGKWVLAFISSTWRFASIELKLEIMKLHNQQDQPTEDIGNQVRRVNINIYCTRKGAKDSIDPTLFINKNKVY